MSIETLQLLHQEHCLFLIKKKLKTLSIETFCTWVSYHKNQAYNKEKAQKIEHRNCHYLIILPIKRIDKEKAQNIEHRNSI